MLPVLPGERLHEEPLELHAPRPGLDCLPALRRKVDRPSVRALQLAPPFAAGLEAAKGARLRALPITAPINGCTDEVSTVRSGREQVRYNTGRSLERDSADDCPPALASQTRGRTYRRTACVDAADLLPDLYRTGRNEPRSINPDRHAKSRKPSSDDTQRTQQHDPPPDQREFKSPLAHQKCLT